MISCNLLKLPFKYSIKFGSFKAYSQPIIKGSINSSIINGRLIKSKFYNKHLTSNNFKTLTTNSIFNYNRSYTTNSTPLHYFNTTENDKVCNLLSLAILTLLLIDNWIDINPYTERVRFMFKLPDILYNNELKNNSEDESHIKKLIIINNINLELKTLINSVLHKLILSSGESELYRFKNGINWYLIDSKDTEAYSLSNGVIIIPMGLVKNLNNNEDQLAFILAKELSHILSDHKLEQKSTLNFIYFTMGLCLGFFKLPKISKIAKPLLLAMTIVPSTIYLTIWHSRVLERESDTIAFYLTVRSGYNPLEYKSYLNNYCKAYLTLFDELSSCKPFNSHSSYIKYYILYKYLIDKERYVNIQELILLNQNFINFSLKNPNYNWLPLKECEYWLNRKTN